jgi:hypothetical protein
MKMKSVNGRWKIIVSRVVGENISIKRRMEMETLERNDGAVRARRAVKKQLFSII